jgi:hypothetical protein
MGWRARAELVTLAVPWHEEDGAAGAGAGAAFRDPVFYVMNSVPNGLRLTFPPAAAIQPPLPELPQARARAAAAPPPAPARAAARVRPVTRRAHAPAAGRQGAVGHPVRPGRARA